jgi:hypothetical protein
VCAKYVLAEGELATPRSNVLRIVEEKHSNGWVPFYVGGVLLLGYLPIGLPWAVGAFSDLHPSRAGEATLGIAAGVLLGLAIFGLATPGGASVVYQAQ